MAHAIISAIFKLVMKLVAIVLSPLDLLIKTFIPGLTDVFASINGFFDYLGDIASFAVSYLGYTSTTLSIVVTLLTLILTLPLAVHVVKLALKWYRTLMP